MGWFFVILFAALIIIPFYKAYQSKTREKEIQQEQEQQGIIRLTQQALELDSGRLPVLSDTPIFLNEVETAHLSMSAARLITKNKMVGRIGSGAGASVHIVKGISVRTGGGSSQAIYRDVTNSFKGELILTNQRLIFLNAPQGFECKLRDITAITGDEQNVEIQTKRKSYSLLIVSHEYLIKALQLLKS